MRTTAAQQKGRSLFKDSRTDIGYEYMLLSPPRGILRSIVVSLSFTHREPDITREGKSYVTYRLIRNGVPVVVENRLSPTSAHSWHLNLNPIPVLSESATKVDFPSCVTLRMVSSYSLGQLAIRPNFFGNNRILEFSLY